VSAVVKTVDASSSNDVEVQNQTAVAAAAGAAGGVQSPVKAAAVQMPNLDSFAAKLNNFSVVLSEKARSRPVVVGNVGEIESAVDIKKVTHTHAHTCTHYTCCFSDDRLSFLSFFSGCMLCVRPILCKLSCC